MGAWYRGLGDAQLGMAKIRIEIRIYGRRNRIQLPDLKNRNMLMIYLKP